MHWFDRVSRQLAAAPEAQTTRRGVLKGVGAAAVAAPFASYATAYAKNVVKAHQAFDLCTACINNAYDDYTKGVRACYQTYTVAKKASSSAGFAAAKKTTRKSTPAQSANMLKCMSTVRVLALREWNNCRTGAACVSGPALPGVTATGSTTCPPGTNSCPGNGVIAICCYGSDLCCPCSTNAGYICCVSAVGCGCCG